MVLIRFAGRIQLISNAAGRIASWSEAARVITDCAIAPAIVAVLLLPSRSSWIAVIDPLQTIEAIVIKLLREYCCNVSAGIFDPMFLLSQVAVVIWIVARRAPT